MLPSSILADMKAMKVMKAMKALAAGQKAISSAKILLTGQERKFFFKIMRRVKALL